MKKHGNWKYRLALLPVLAAAGVCAAEKPLFETDFRQNEKGAVIDNISPDKPGKIIGKNISIVDTAIGKAAKFEAAAGNRIEFPATAELNTPDEFTITAWFNVAELPSADAERNRRCGGIICRGWWLYGIITPKGEVNGNAKQLYPLNGPTKQVVPGEWMHFAYTYSVSNKRYDLFVNGQKVATRSANWKKQVPVPIEFRNGPKAKDMIYFGSVMGFWLYNGMVGRSRLYGKALTAEEIVLSEQDLVRKQLEALKKEIAGNASAAALAAKIESLLKQTVIPINEVSRCRSEKKRLDNINALKKSGKLTNSDLAYSVVDPMGRETFSYDTPLPEEGMNGKILIMAAQNEFEPASFLIKPLRNLPGFLPVAGDLKSREGHTIPASALDMRLVKVMVVCNSFNRGPGAMRALKPFVLLYDDKLVRVDPEQMHNDIRLSFPDGDKYIRISGEDGSPKGYIFKTEKYPIRDAKTIQALDLKEGVNQQYWITLKTDKNTKPGLYESKIDLTSNGKTLASIPLKVRILPYELPEPKTNYDLRRPFYVSTYYFHELAEEGAGSVGFKQRSIAQTRADLKNLYEHGVRLPTTLMEFFFPRVYFPWNKKYPIGTPMPDPTEKQLEKNRILFRLMKESGMWMKPLILHTGGNFGYREFYQRKRDRANLEKIVKKTLDICEKEVGHRDAMFYSVDEAEGKRITAQYEVWEDMKKFGAGIFVTAKPENEKLLLGHGVTVLNYCHPPRKKNADAAHKDNTLVWKYANPFAGPDKNDRTAIVMRLNYGFQLYFTDHDGVCSYSFNHYAAQLPWNTFGAGSGLVYALPTADGMVDTPPWEGHREGIDDVRYATKLRQEIVKARKGGAGQRALAEEAAAFLDNLDPHSPEFDSRKVRWQIIDKTLDLIEMQKESSAK